MMDVRWRRLAVLFAVSLPIAVQTASAQALSGNGLVAALREGGYVIVMRHASSPREEPDGQTANDDNVDRERQLDAEGRAGATAMGEAIRTLDIPVGEVLSSPTYRALETVRYAGYRKHGTGLQVEILLLLAGRDPDETDWRRVSPVPGKLFIVGDPKQSIYRFRRAPMLPCTRR